MQCIISHKGEYPGCTVKKGLLEVCVLAVEGCSFWTIIEYMGIGFVVAGVYSLLTMEFGYLTKFAFKWTIKSLIYIYRRR